MSNAIQSPNDHIESLRGERGADPKRPNRLGSNNITTRVAEWYGRKCKTIEKNKRMG